MTREMMYSKIHRATVTESNINYVGSITIDEKLMEAVNIYEYQKVDILNVNNGERFETYAIKGARGSGNICINGAAARKCMPEDIIIIISYVSMDDKDCANHKPITVFVDNKNKIKGV